MYFFFSIAILGSRYDTRIAGPSIAMHRCIDASLRPYYFCNIAEKLVNKLPLRTYGEDRVEDLYKRKGVERNSFKFNVVGQDGVENILKSLDVAKSVGEDKICS